MAKNTDMSAFTDGRVPDSENDQSASQSARNTIAFGMDMENFLRTDVGRYLARCASQEIDGFLVQLAEIDAEDPKAIRTLQQEIAARRMWKDWINVAIQAGHAAIETSLERNAI